MKKKTRRSQAERKWKALREALQTRTAISYAELTGLVKKNTGVATDYAVWRLLREGILVKIRRGLYGVARGGTGAGFLNDPTAALITLLGKETVFCYGTALYVHGLSRYAKLSEYYVASSRDKKTLRIGTILARFIEPPLNLEKGTMRHKFGRSHIRVTDLERTLIDCIHRPKYAQGWENVVHALHSATQLNTGRMIRYVKQYGIPLLTARVGVVLEHFASEWKVNKNDLDSLLTYLPRHPVAFERGTKGPLINKWRIYMAENYLDE